MRSLLTITAILQCLVLVNCSDPADESQDAAGRPVTVLWAWQRSEDLTYIDPATTAIALWIGSVTLQGEMPAISPRHAPVSAPTGVPMLGVIRLEQASTGTLTPVSQLVDVVGSLVQPWNVQEVQLDFDAAYSQRSYYQQLIEQLRQRMPDLAISITALASWCFGDPWIEALDVDGAVPMLYRMGQDGEAIRHKLSSQRHVSARICRDNIGYSLDEDRLAVDVVQRVFWYNPVAWDAASYQQVVEKMRVLYPTAGGDSD